MTWTSGSCGAGPGDNDVAGGGERWGDGGTRDTRAENAVGPRGGSFAGPLETAAAPLGNGCGASGCRASTRYVRKDLDVADVASGVTV